MKIFFVNSTLPTCGGIITNFEYVKELRKRGIEAYLLAEETTELNKHYGIESENLTSICRAGNEDVIIANRWEQCYLLEKYNGRKIQFVQGKDLVADYGEDWKQRLIAKRNDKKWELIGVSRYCLEDWKRGEVIPNGINNRFFENIEVERDIDILVEGNNEPNKGVDLALKVAKQVGGRILWMGRDTKKVEGVETITSPKQEDIPSIYRRSKVMLKFSKSEGFSLPILEAMACGCTVVTHDMGGNDFCNDDNCYMVRNGDYVGAVREALKKPKNEKETAKQFTWERSVDLLLNYLNEPRPKIG